MPRRGAGRKGEATEAAEAEPKTLAVDIGGTSIKASAMAADGTILGEPVKVKTPKRVDPGILLDTIAELVTPLPECDRVSAGFPGIVVDGVVYTAPNLGNRAFRGFDLEEELGRRLGKPTRVVNDGEMHGLGAITGTGIEIVVTLGTGVGIALVLDGRLGPQIALAPHPSHHGGEDDEFGDRARKRRGNKKWSRRVESAIELLRDLTDFDHLYIGGGNAKLLRMELPDDITLIDNEVAILGSVKVWEQRRRKHE